MSKTFFSLMQVECPSKPHTRVSHEMVLWTRFGVILLASEQSLEWKFRIDKSLRVDLAFDALSMD